jgi:hypothetical protein
MKPLAEVDHILILNQRQHLQLVLAEYRRYFNASRPHQRIDQRCSSRFDASALGRKRPRVLESSLSPSSAACTAPYGTKRANASSSRSSSLDWQ